MLVLLTDFGWSGPYVGQLKLALTELSPKHPIVDLIHDLPRFNIKAASYLLHAYTALLPKESISIAVVDPGVGSTLRDGIIINADGKWFVGPGNGLFDQVCMMSTECHCWRITWMPEHISASFHGRDLFAPIAAMLANGTSPELLGEPVAWQSQGWLEELEEVIYIDGYGNCVCGMWSERHPLLQHLLVNGLELSRAYTFADVPRGEPMFYSNSSGLIEIAVNQGRADKLLRLQIGSPIVLPKDK